MRYIIGTLLIFGLIFALNYHRLYRTLPKNETRRNGQNLKRNNIIKDLLYYLPRQLARNFSRIDRNKFPEQGLILFQGRQGQGKTLSMIRQATIFKQKYNDLYICGNLKFTQSEKTIQDATEILKLNKGNTGCCILIDEIQVFWNSKNSKNLDESVTSCITSMRKNVRLMMGTCQNFYMVSKDLRSQCRLLCNCITPNPLPLTIIVKKEPIMDSMGELKKMKFKGIDYFIHTDELYNSYDTEEMIRILNKKGLKARNERATRND